MHDGARAQGNVIGALYGERQRGSPIPPQVNGKLEAMLVDLLACGVSAGLARQEQQLALLRGYDLDGLDPAEPGQQTAQTYRY